MGKLLSKKNEVCFFNCTKHLFVLKGKPNFFYIESSAEENVFNLSDFPLKNKLQLPERLRILNLSKALSVKWSE